MPSPLPQSFAHTATTTGVEADLDTDVLIIGAGPTGLTLACDLARRGVRHRIIERAPRANRASKAKTIQPRALEVLDDLGAAPFVLQRGVVDLPVRFHDAAGAVTDRPTMSVRAAESFHSPFPDPVWVGQFDVEEALRRRLADFGGAVQYGLAAVNLEQDRDGAKVTLASGQGEQRVRARYVVAADGGKSGVRKLVGLSLTGETYEDQRWYLGDVTATGLDRDLMHIWTSERGMIGLTPLPSSDLWQLQSPIRPEDEASEPSLVLYQSMLDERAGSGVVTLTSATWLSVYRVNVRMVEHYRQGRVFLAGDAAHVHSPAGGQGMNTGIQDAYNLGWKLATAIDGADDSLLDTYESERLPVARAVLDDSTHKMQRTTATATGSSRHGLSAALASIADDVTTGLPVGYSDSPLTLHDPLDSATLVRPGSRVPDANGLQHAKFTSSLFDLLRGPHWTLIAFEHSGPLALDQAKTSHLHVHRIGSTPGSDVADTLGEFALHYRAESGDLFLIRPDGYLAARVQAGREAVLIAYLATYRAHDARL
jgi:2-polyprenyl-6-methoxyphenol hydroxylase-like FAD-dependent oxidoreductase